MTDPAPGVGDNNPHEIRDVATYVSLGPTGSITGSKSQQTTDHRSNQEDLEASRGDSETEEAAKGVSDSESDEYDVDDDAEDEDEDNDEEGEDDNEEDEDGEDGEDEDQEQEEDEDEEPRLKYARLTQHLGGVYRNADATSSFTVAGDKMVIGTHNGNIHVIQLPAFQSLRVYHAHSASVTSVSLSPFPPVLNPVKPEVAARAMVAAGGGVSSRPESRHSGVSPAATARKAQDPNPVPNTPSNNVFIATSSMDGNVCVQSLIDVKDVQLRNFARPVQSVALSPDFKTDRTYLSGGTAGSLVLTVGAPTGRSTSTTVGTAAATASGWLGTMGLGSNTGKDTVLHSGEGIISTIKYSLSGKYVVWLNEHGIKIMRSSLHLESGDPEDSWKRIGHIDRPQTDEWETMAGVWKGRVEWIDETAIPAADDERDLDERAPSPAAEKLKLRLNKEKQKIERLLVGWGGTIWIIHVHPGGVGAGKEAGEKTIGRAEIVRILRMDCIISGISLYTQSLLLVLAYPLATDDDENDHYKGKKAVKGHKPHQSKSSGEGGPSGGVKRRQNNSPPELRLIDLVSQAEIDKDSLSISRFERLTSNDYHLGVLPQHTASAVVASKGYLEAVAGLGVDMWNVAMLPGKALFSSAASIRSGHSNDGASGSRVAPSSTGGSVRAYTQRQALHTVHPNLAKPGTKIFVHSPYDCILAAKRDLSDHLAWLVERRQFERAWELVDENPDIITAADTSLEQGPPLTPIRSQPTQSSDDFYDDTASTLDGLARNVLADKEKRRIGELWLQQLVEAGAWERAGQVAGKVLTSSDRWEKWVYVFAGAKKFDEITNYIPIEPMRPPIPSTIYEIVLNHYVQSDKLRFKDLLDRWSPDLFDVNTITTALENQLKYRDVRPDSVQDGMKGRDWSIVMGSLAKLCEANGRHREALRCYIKLHDADSAMRLIKDGHLADAVADDIPSFVTLRVPPGKEDGMTMEELEKATIEAITLLVDEAQHGLVRPEVVVSQLQQMELKAYLFFYLRALFKGDGIQEHMGENRDRLVMESQSLVDGFADLAVHFFALYDQSILMHFLKTSTSYTFEKAVQECEDHNYVPELVYLYSKTGQMKRALYLIIDRLGDVSRAITFAKDLNDPDLWEDLLKYSMDKPRFIRGLLEQVGTAINPITLVRRIPEGLEIDGLREGLKHIMKEHEIQYSISEGVATVLRSEVAAAQATLRNGQRKGMKFEVMVKRDNHVDIEARDIPSDQASIHSGTSVPPPATNDDKASDGDHDSADRAPMKKPAKNWKAGHCASPHCLEPFSEWEIETLVGFACGHVYHLTHLLEVLHPDDPLLHDVADFGHNYEDEESHDRRRTIGTKVTHARLLRDRVRGGCPICHQQQGVVACRFFGNCN